MENFGGLKKAPTDQLSNYFEGIASGKPFLAAKTFTEKFINTGKVAEAGLTLSDTPADIEALTVFISGILKKLVPGVTPSEIIEQLKKAELIAHTPVVKEIKPVVEPEFIHTQYVKLETPKVAEVDEETIKLVEANLLFEEVHKAKIFKNEEELQTIYEQAISLEDKRLPETPEYYHQFDGLVKGGAEEVDNDLEWLKKVKQNIKNAEPADLTKKNRLHEAMQIAKITERAVAHGVSNLEWYGKDISIEPTPEFTDMKSGIDDLMEIKKDGADSDFMGLGIDVTFRGLHSEQFKYKFFTLLGQITSGYAGKVKYFKNHQGEKMKEFFVPKMVLSFNMDDVKDLVEMIKNSDTESLRETYKNSPQKFNVMNQIINSCTKLSLFAEECQNSVFRRYTAVVNSIKELSWDNPEIQMMLNIQHDDKVSRRLDELIEEFKKTDQYIQTKK